MKWRKRALHSIEDGKFCYEIMGNCERFSHQQKKITLTWKFSSMETPLFFAELIKAVLLLFDAAFLFSTIAEHNIFPHFVPFSSERVLENISESPEN